VCVALADHFEVPVARIRLGAVVLAVLGGAGVLLYLWLWVFVPRDRGEPARPPTRAVPVAGLLLIASGIAAVTSAITWNLPTLLPVGAVESGLLAVGAAAWASIVDPRDPRHAPSAPTSRVVAAGLLLVLGIGLFPFTLLEGRPVVAVLSAALGVAGVAVLVLPAVLARLSERSTERAALAREEQRSEIAAHLHDSVLQTLAIIQNRAGTGSEIARIARAQERELRDWLFAGTDPFARDLATELRMMARELELEHPARIEVVTVGDVGGVESHALASAAREALTNAARHAGGEVTVYAEATENAVDVFVRDRGPGFDPADVPAGRLGIRESILGRMTRAGGTASVEPGADGTEVHLRLPRRTGVPA
jgi:signal transduction histidine kinase/phage shock protein PspC (stress-responsive transcriptional regulator)